MSRKKGRVHVEEPPERTRFEEALLDRYRALDQRRAPSAATPTAEVVSRRKEELIAMAREREEAERLRFQRTQDLKRAKANPPSAEGAVMAEGSAGSVSAPAYVDDASAAAPTLKKRGAQEFDPAALEAIFPDCQFVDAAALTDASDKPLIDRAKVSFLRKCLSFAD